MKQLLVFFSFCVLAFVARAQDDLIKVTDMLRIRNVGSITLTSDGSKAAFVLNSIIAADSAKTDYKYLSQIWLLNTATGETTQLTTAKEGASQPVWSPDGKNLAFVRAVDGRAQIFILPMKGGEPWQLTRYAYGASNPKWSPDGNKMLFTSGLAFKNYLTDSLLNPDLSLPSWSFERYGFENNSNLKKPKVRPDPNGNIDQARAWLETNVADNKAIVLNRLVFQDESNISAEMNFNHIFITDVNRESKPKELTKGFYRFNNGIFTPDGSKIIFTGNIDSLQHPDRSNENSIYMIDTSGKNFHVVLSAKEIFYNTPVISPSGKKIAFQYDVIESVSIPHLAVIDLSDPKKITTYPFDRGKANVNWSDDERYLYFTAQSNGGNPLYRLELATKKLEQLSDVNSGITSYDIANGRIVYSFTSPANPSQLFIADANMKNTREAGSFNGWVKEKKLSIPEKHFFTNEKGMKVEYWVMKPVNYSAGKKYPLLLEIHGGPSSMWGPGETSMWHEFQYFCSKGYGVVYSNPRGSSGYGLDFLRGNIEDWGEGPTKDVLGALDRTVAEGWTDTSKLLITGGSYAGYLTAWIIAHDHRFKAACAQRGVYDLNTFFGEGNAWRLVPYYFGGYPWEPKVKALLERESPITYVQNITTPFIIFHGDNDRRTGFVQSEMMFRSLKVLGRPVEYVRHPNATHEITRSGENRQRIDQMLRTYEFFERWIR
jgi:dipeptidyl aminopeptidase/acylaminoacyl peptidase